MHRFFFVFLMLSFGLQDGSEEKEEDGRTFTNYAELKKHLDERQEKRRRSAIYLLAIVLVILLLPRNNVSYFVMN